MAKCNRTTADGDADQQKFCSTASTNRQIHLVERSAADDANAQPCHQLRVLPSPAVRGVSRVGADDELRELIRSVQKRRAVSPPPDEFPPAA